MEKPQILNWIYGFPFTQSGVFDNDTMPYCFLYNFSR